MHKYGPCYCVYPHPPCIMGRVRLPHSIGDHPCGLPRWPAMMPLQQTQFTNPEETELSVCVQMNKWCVFLFYRGDIMVNGLYSRRLFVSMVWGMLILFVLSWARLRQVCLGSISPVVFIDGVGVYIILLFYSFARCFEIMVVCIIVRLMCMSCSVMVYRCMLKFLVYLVLLNVVCFLSPGMGLFIISLCGCDGCWLFFCLIWDPCSLRCSWSGSSCVSREGTVCIHIFIRKHTKHILEQVIRLGHLYISFENNKNNCTNVPLYGNCYHTRNIKTIVALLKIVPWLNLMYCI